MTSDEQVLLKEKDGGVLRLTLNRPSSLNALNRELGTALLDALNEAADDDDVRSILLSGAGRAFCAGDDIRAGAAAAAAGEPRPRGDLIGSMRSSNYGRFALAFRACPKPIVTKIHGFAYGAGMDLCIASDISIAANSAKIGAVFVKRAIIGGTAQLPRVVGIKKAIEMLLTGEPVEAPDAERFGLINYAVPDEELDAKVEEFAQKLAAGPTRVMGNIKWAAYQGLEVPFNQAVLLASAFQGEGGRTEDRIEGGKSFSEKREAAYTGR